jgi:YD repeat-containing protein
MSGDPTQPMTAPLLQNPGGIYSQSNNFLGVVQSGVDARTGQFNLAISLPKLHANALSGPSFGLTLSFNPLASAQNQGFGFGWSALLSELTLDQDPAFLRLSSGEQFAVDREKSDTGIGGEVVFLDHKLKTLKVTRQNDRSFRLDNKSGDIEILRQVIENGPYVVQEMRSAEGRALFMEWQPYGNGGQVLRRIRDQDRSLMEVERSPGRVEFTFDAGSSFPSVVTLGLANEQVQTVGLPGITSRFKFGYDLIDVGAGVPLLFPNHVTSPLGAGDSVVWSSQRAGHQLPDGAPIRYVPRVASWKHQSADPETALYRHYRWVGNANYFGFGSDSGFVWEDGRDNLYSVNSDYRYCVVETLSDRTQTTLSTITRVWNRFHLQILEDTVRGAARRQVETLYHINDAQGWAAQPAYCQLPHRVTTTYSWEGPEGPEGPKRSELTEYLYDDFGNVTYTRFPSGVTKTNLYHCAQGNEDCPPDALGMVRFLSETVTTPGPSDFPSPTLCTKYRYENLSSLIPEDPPRAVVVEEQAWSVTEAQLLENTSQTYVQDPGPDYAALKSAVTTLNGLSTTTRYVYTRKDGLLHTQTIIEGHDFDTTSPVSRSISSDSRSLLTGVTMQETSAAGAITAYEYDALGRIIRTVIARDSKYESTRTCKYYLDDEFTRSNRPANLASSVAIEETDASTRGRRSWLDGGGRVIAVELQDLDNAPGIYREISRSTYDPLGQLIASTAVEWHPDGSRLFELKTVTRYDDWGHACHVTSPTGVASISTFDPVQLRSEGWRQSVSGACTGKQVSHHNVVGSPVRQEVFDDQGLLVRAVVLNRDGLDRVVEKRIKVAGEDDLVTRYRYDSYSRIVEHIGPDLTCVTWAYAAHSDAEHPESVTLTESLS